MRIFCCLMAWVFIVSCKSGKVPSGIIPPEKMEILLWEQMRADAFTREYISKDSAKDVLKENLLLQEKIFQKYGTDKDAFYKSYDYYVKHETLMKDLLDSVVAIEARKGDKIKDRINKLRHNEQGQKDR